MPFGSLVRSLITLVFGLVFGALFAGGCRSRSGAGERHRPTDEDVEVQPF